MSYALGECKNSMYMVTQYIMKNTVLIFYRFIVDFLGVKGYKVCKLFSKFSAKIIYIYTDE